MFSPVFSEQMGRAVTFVPEPEPVLALRRLAALPKLAGVTPASQLGIRPLPEMVSSGIREIDALTGGLPRGCLSEICGPSSSGRTSVLLAVLAAATRRGEVGALVDTTDALDPISAASAEVDLERLLWVRCGKSNIESRTSDCGSQTSNIGFEGRDAGFDDRCPSHRRGPTPQLRSLEQALRVTDLLLQSGGFGLIAIDLGDVPHTAARRIPLASWFRFQRAVETTPTVLLVVDQEACAQSCAALLIRLQSSILGRQSSGEELSIFSDPLSERDPNWPTQAQLLDGLHIEGELLRSRLGRKPSQSVTAAFATRAVRIA